MNRWVLRQKTCALSGVESALRGRSSGFPVKIPGGRNRRFVPASPCSVYSGGYCSCIMLKREVETLERFLCWEP